MSTRQTRRRSASGWAWASRTRPTTKFSSAATPWVSTRSTSVPVMARRSASAWALRSGRQYSCNQLSGTRMASELLQEANVVVVEQAQVGDAVLEHGDALDAHAEGEALHPVGVVAVVLDVGEHVGIDHPGTEDLDPRRALAQRAALAIGGDAAGAVEARNVGLDAGLGEGEEVRSQAHLALLAEDAPREAQQRA